MAQLAAIDQTALQSGTLAGAREVIRAWAVPGGPTASSWSGVRAMAEFFDAAGLSGGGNNQLAIVATPLMGQIKGSVGPDFVLPCVDFEIDVTLQQTARGAAADCQRMVWTGGPLDDRRRLRTRAAAVGLAGHRPGDRRRLPRPAAGASDDRRRGARRRLHPTAVSRPDGARVRRR